MVKNKIIISFTLSRERRSRNNLNARIGVWVIFPSPRGRAREGVNSEMTKDYTTLTTALRFCNFVIILKNIYVRSTPSIWRGNSFVKHCFTPVILVRSTGIQFIISFARFTKGWISKSFAFEDDENSYISKREETRERKRT